MAERIKKILLNFLPPNFSFLWNVCMAPFVPSQSEFWLIFSSFFYFLTPSKSSPSPTQTVVFLMASEKPSECESVSWNYIFDLKSVRVKRVAFDARSQNPFENSRENVFVANDHAFKITIEFNQYYGSPEINKLFSSRMGAKSLWISHVFMPDYIAKLI